MESFIQVAQLIALLSASALCVYLIVTLVRLNGVLDLAQKDLAEINAHIKPLLENLSVFSEKLRSIATKVDEQVNLFKGSLESFKKMSENILEFEERFQQRLEDPLIRISNLIGNIINRFASFFGRVTNQAN